MHENLPHSPGCYLFKDAHGNIIYIGKAKDLKKRVASYFQKRGHDAKTGILVEHIRDVDFIATDNEKEALILERTLIRKHMPRYNIDLKDSKNYAFLQLTDEDFPRLLLARKRDGAGHFYGPFVSAEERDHVRQVLNRTFRIRTCRRMPRRACLRYHIGLCSAPCVGKISEADYARDIRNASMVLKGRTKELLDKLRAEMEIHSEAQRFEYAMRLRDQIFALEHLEERQKMDRARSYDEDVISYIVKDGTVHLAVFKIYKGTLSAKEEYTFAENPDFLEEFATGYYEEKVPKEIIVPRRLSDALAEWLSDKRGGKVRITVPKQGTKKDLLSLAEKNIELALFADEISLEDLQKRLKLQERPSIIDCFDISHLSGTSTVGSMVQFRNAKPYKSNYRRFRIRTVRGIDDPRSIAEVVRRRYSRVIAEQDDLPNLIVVDGGRGQLNAALKELELLHLRIPTVGLAKRFEEVHVPGMSNPIRLERKSHALKLLQRVRDEAHRFAITYQKLLRGKRALE